MILPQAYLVSIHFLFCVFNNACALNQKIFGIQLHIEKQQIAVVQKKEKKKKDVEPLITCIYRILIMR